MLYNPPAFRENDTAALQAQIAASGLATLISVGAEREETPDVDHCAPGREPYDEDEFVEENVLVL